jgi:two-component sensor histidine kinase
MDLEDLYRLLRNGHVQAQGIFDTVPDPLLVLDQHLCVQSASRAFLAAFKVARDETIGQHLYELGNRQWDIPELRHLLEDVIPKSTAVVDYEVEHDFPALGQRTMLVSAHRLFHPDNNSRTLLLSIVDATKRREREAEKDLLVGELRHRMKNLLGLVQAIARQTSVQGRSGEEYRDAFLGRFNALVQAHEVAFSEDDETGLKELVERTLEPYASHPASVLIEAGPIVPLVAGQVMSLSLILHELATNAVKYGALSVPSGQVRVRWDAEEASARCLRLVWQETGGPPVATPNSLGFGTKLIEFAARHELGGEVELNYTSAGLEAEIVAPLGSVS